MALPSTVGVLDNNKSLPESVPHLPVTLDVRAHDLETACEAFGTQWHALLKRGGFNISLAPEFVKAAAASVGVAAQVRVLTAHRGSELVGVIPFVPDTSRMFSVPMKTLSLAGNLISYHHEVAALDCQEELLRALLCDPARNWHVLRMENVPVDGPTCRALHKLAREERFALVSYRGDVAPYLPITLSWEQFLASKSGNFRSNLKRKEKSLRKGGDLTERWFHAPDDVSELYRCMQVVESKSWKSSADVAVTAESSEALYYRELLPFLARHGLLFANVLYLDQQPVAYHLCYFHEGRVGNMKTSFDEARQALSPGAVVIQRAVQQAFQAGAREFDFLGDDQYHKRLWTDSARSHQTHFLFSRNLRSRAIGLAKTFLQTRRKTEFHAVIRRSETLDSEG